MEAALILAKKWKEDKHNEANRLILLFVRKGLHNKIKSSRIHRYRMFTKNE
jgi:hypothetical protein